MKISRPPRIILEGDIDSAKSLVGKAYQESSVLSDLMKFQSLQQGARIVSFSDGSEISLRNTFGQVDINIFAPVPSVEEIIEEYPGVFILKLSVIDETGEYVPVTLQMLKYLAFYPSTSTGYNKIGEIDKNQPAYLYDPDTMYRRDEEGFLNRTLWGDEKNAFPIEGEDGFIIPTEFINNYQSGNAYWISYAIGYEPCAVVTQYPARTEEEDKWIEEDLVTEGTIVEDIINVGFYTSITAYPYKEQSSGIYAVFDILNDKIVYFPFDVDGQSTDIVEVLEEEVETKEGDFVTVRSVGVFDYRDLDNNSKGYINQIGLLGRDYYGSQSTITRYYDNRENWHTNPYEPGRIYFEETVIEPIIEEGGTTRVAVIPKWEPHVSEEDDHYYRDYIKAESLYYGDIGGGVVGYLLNQRDYTWHHWVIHEGPLSFAFEEFTEETLEFSDIVLPFGTFPAPDTLEFSHYRSAYAFATLEEEYLGKRYAGMVVYSGHCYNWAVQERFHLGILFMPYWELEEVSHDITCGEVVDTSLCYWTSVYPKWKSLPVDTSAMTKIEPYVEGQSPFQSYTDQSNIQEIIEGVIGDAVSGNGLNTIETGDYRIITKVLGYGGSSGF